MQGGWQLETHGEHIQPPDSIPLPAPLWTFPPLCPFLKPMSYHTKLVNLLSCVYLPWRVVAISLAVCNSLLKVSENTMEICKNWRKYICKTSSNMSPTCPLTTVSLEESCHLRREGIYRKAVSKVYYYWHRISLGSSTTVAPWTVGKHRYQPLPHISPEWRVHLYKKLKAIWKFPEWIICIKKYRVSLTELRWCPSSR
jgi:hypothetical protein